ncbi:MAG: hypothetical protein AAF368_08730, partial [Planctomycetota bacterium]
MQAQHKPLKFALLGAVTAFLATSCINKSGGGSDVVIGFTSGGVNCSEGSSETITLELTLQVPVLEADASVDVVDIGSGKTVIEGDDNNNTITGTGDDEIIYGYGGDDTLDGAGGN